MMRQRQRTLRRQRGVAVITALLLTTLAISIVASLFWQQQVQVRSMENQRLHLQTKWILRGALDWATVVLRQSGYSTQWTSLDQAWATPLAETRLDQYIERERVEGEVFDATLSGNIVDATSRYNLSNLASNGVPNQDQVDIFRRLLVNLQLSPSLATPTMRFVAEGQQLATGQPPNPLALRAQGRSPIRVLGVDDLLAVPGMTPAALEKLRPFVVVLPELPPGSNPQFTTVNVNTASPELLASVIEKTSVSEAHALVARRKQAPWKNDTDFRSYLPQKTVVANSTDTVSDYFLVESRIRLDRAALNAQALIHRRRGAIGAAGTSVVWIRQN